MHQVSGIFWTGQEFRRGTVSFAAGRVQDISGDPEEETLAHGLILPTFFNAHTHSGDAFIKEEIEGSLEEVVGPPLGLKHRRLAAAKDEEVVHGMRGYFERMWSSGTSHFVDFREGGVKGVSLLYEAGIGLPLDPIVLGRPTTQTYDPKEVEGLLHSCDGIGVSSFQDWEPSELEKLAKHCRDQGAFFGLHASERIRENVDPILDLKPRFLVHMTCATKEDLLRCKEEGVAIAVCPRSNAFFGKLPDLPMMASSGADLLLGTDNAMVNSPSLFKEMEFAHKVARLHGPFRSDQVFAMVQATRRFFRPKEPAGLQIGGPADLIVLRAEGSGSIFKQVVNASDADIQLVSLGGRVWLRKSEAWTELPAGSRDSPSKT